MGTTAESTSFERETQSAASETISHTAAIRPSSDTSVDSFVAGLFAGVPGAPSGTAARLLSQPGLKIPVMQFAQRTCGNQALQRLVLRARALQRQCDCDGTCPKCRNSASTTEEERRRLLQRQSAHGTTGSFDGIPAGAGEPLAAATRAPLEQHFGTDLADVRVHTGADTAESASRMDALAYTSGRDIYFAPGMYAPSARSGRRLLAHEVAHVVQQGSGKEPSIAMKSAEGVKIGAPDDPLELEADREAEEFMNGAAPQFTAEEQRRRRELGVVERNVQQSIQRQPAPNAPAVNAPAPAQPKPEPQAPPVPQGEVVKTLDGVQLVEDPAFMRYQLEQLIVKGWGDSHYRFQERLERDIEIDEMAGDRAFKKQYEESGGQVAAGVPRSQEDFDAYDRMKEKERRVLEIVRPIVIALDQERAKVVSDFETIAKDRARATLDASEKQEQSEAARYGIKWEMVEQMRSDCMLGDCKYTVTTYAMGEQSPAVTGLQGAAKVLIGRRNEMDEAREQMEQAQRDSLDALASCAGEGAGSYAMDCPGSTEYAKRRQETEEKFKKKKDAYDLMRGYLSDQYPVLGAFSDPEKSVSDLKKLVSQTAGPEMAALLGKQIVDRLVNIAKVRDGLNNSGEVNIWRLPDLVRMTGEMMGLSSKPVWDKWVTEKVKDEQPGIFWSIALAVLNIAALIAAPVTGGVSLAIAAGVNTVVAIQHIKEYEMQKALGGTAFDKANALSQEEPSLFWLAVEVVGVAVDAAAAFKAISSAVKAVKAVEEAGDAVRVVQKTEELKNVARSYGGEKLAARVVAGLGEGAGAEAKALKALEVTGEESKLLEAGARAAEQELEAGVVAGRVAGEGGTKISRAGHIFVCHSPCEYMLSKYSELLGPEITLEREATSLKSQYKVLEEEASKAAEAVRTAPPEKLAEAREAAAAVERKVAAFDEKLARETSYSQAQKKFAMLDPAASEKLLKLEKNAAIRFAGLDADSLQRLGQLEADSLNKLASWGLDSSALERLLAKGANAGHVKGQLLEELLNLKMAQPGELAKHVPPGLLKQLEKQGAKLEFIPGHVIKDADGALITDGIIGYWEGDRLKIVTFFEAKGGAPAARGLRYSWTGIPKAERADLLKTAQNMGLEALRKEQQYQDLAEVLSEAAADVKRANKAAAKLTLDEVVKQFPNDVERAWSKLPQSEAGQIRKTTERLTEGGGVLRINGKEVQTATIGGHAPNAVGVLPAGVTEKTLEETMKAGGIRNFERLEDIAQDELNAMANKIASTSTPAPAKPNP